MVVIHTGPHHHHHQGLNQVDSRVELLVPLAIAMSVHVDGACGAAMRRRQRRLRAQWRHEQQTVAMVLATVGHHSFGPTAHGAPRSQWTTTSTREEVENETNNVLRHKTTPPPGMRPGRLAEPVPQGFWSGPPRQPGSGVPSLSTPVLADHDGRRSRRWCPRLPHRASCGGCEEGGGGQVEGGAAEQRPPRPLSPLLLPLRLTTTRGASREGPTDPPAEAVPEAGAAVGISGALPHTWLDRLQPRCDHLLLLLLRLLMILLFVLFYVPAMYVVFLTVLSWFTSWHKTGTVMDLFGVSVA